MATIKGKNFDDELLGTNADDFLYGCGNDDWLTGGSGNDVLIGGLGADTMLGGQGNDIYYVDDAGDQVMELAGEGLDTVRSTIGYVLGADVENLTLQGSANLDGTGNDLDNMLTGNSGSNVLDGGLGDDTLNGRAGADTLIGGDGDDTYVVDQTDDIVVEAAGEGTDKVISGVSYVLGADVEKLSLRGSANLDGTGNVLNNILAGNSGSNVLDGGLGNDTLNGRAGADTLIGGDGNDTYVVDQTDDVVIEAAGEGTDTVVSTVTYVLGAEIENLSLRGSANLSGTGNDLNNILAGNSGSNVLAGGLGNDTLNGRAGADTLIGGDGDDTYVVDQLDDVVVEAAGEGTDKVISMVTYALGAEVENLSLWGIVNLNGTGNGFNNELVGNLGGNLLDAGAGNDSLYGGLGADTLMGGEGDDYLQGEHGADTLIGGIGDDVYVVEDGDDLVIENIGEGIDTVVSWVSFALEADDEVEILMLVGEADNYGTGNGFGNLLVGNVGDNVLDGGAGADTMTGGAGDDTYHVDSASDVISESVDDGTDTVVATTSYALGNNVENLTLSGLAAVYATGNALANTLIGTTNGNTMDGGSGADTMVGGAGNDIYYVENSSDAVVELADEGFDTVYSSVSWHLGNAVEHLTLTGNGNINAQGNTLGNILTGNSGANLLDGGTGDDTLDGGAGGDLMIGGAGNDTFYVEQALDVVMEAAGEGIDTVVSSVNLTLGENVENLTLDSGTTGGGNALDNVITGNTGTNFLSGGAGDDLLDGLAGIDTLNGEAGADALLGGNGADILSGGTDNDSLSGGLGTDTLTGGSGADSFVFNTAFSGSNSDTITDFNSIDDTIVLDNAIFTGLSDGTLAAGAFRVGTAALDADDRIVFNGTTGGLFYDADGNGAGAAIQFATVTSPVGGVSAGDFLVV